MLYPIPNSNAHIDIFIGFSYWKPQILFHLGWKSVMFAEYLWYGLEYSSFLFS